MTARPTILFACSSQLHARLFSRVIGELATESRYAPVLISLGGYYEATKGDVAAYAIEHGLPATVLEPDFSGAALGSIIRRIRVARCMVIPNFAELIQQQAAALVVLGNDTGHAERAIIAAARQARTPTLLIQDGFHLDPFGHGPAGHVALALRRLWRWGGGAAIGWLPYGMGGTSAIAAHGNRSAAIFERIRSPRTRLVESAGHPSLVADAASLPTHRTITFFCTNFLTGLKDRAGHQRQLEEIGALHREITRLPGICHTLNVKLHPADRLEDYAKLKDRPGIALHHDTPLAAIIAATWLGVTNMSAVVLDCAAASRVCLMSTMPAPGLEISSASELPAWIETLATEAGYQHTLHQQAARLDRFVEGLLSGRDQGRLRRYLEKVIALGAAS